MMNSYTLIFANGNVIGFENDQEIEDILNILNNTRDEYINIGSAAIVQKTEIAAIIDNSQTDRHYGGGYEF